MVTFCVKNCLFFKEESNCCGKSIFFLCFSHCSHTCHYCLYCLHCLYCHYWYNCCSCHYFHLCRQAKSLFSQSLVTDQPKDKQLDFQSCSGQLKFNVEVCSWLHLFATHTQDLKVQSTLTMHTHK